MTRERSSVDTKNKILEVAEKEFALSGYSGAHLQLIAEQVGVQKTALYYYFPSKAALYLAVLQRMIEHLNETLLRASQQAGTAPERLERIVSDLNGLLAERPYYSKLLFRIFVDRAPVDFVDIKDSVESVVGNVMRVYRSGVESGEFRRGSSRHFFMSVVGMMFFHYSCPEFAAGVLGVEDIFTQKAVTWRRQEVHQLLANGILAERDDDQEA